MEDIKAFDELLSRDPRIQSSLESYHTSVAGLRLNASVPEDIQTQFNVAVNLLIYSWFCYRFSHVAHSYGLQTLEFALRMKATRERLTMKRPGLKGLLEQAVREAWISDSGFEHYRRLKLLREEMAEVLAFDSQPAPADDRRFCENLAQAFPGLRNAVAHGGTSLWGPGHAFRGLEICRDLINQLFSSVPGAEA